MCGICTDNMKKIPGTQLLFLLFLLFPYGAEAQLRVSMPSQGGTGTGTAPALGELLVGNAKGTYDLKATSTLGFPTFTTLEDYLLASLFYGTTTHPLFYSLPGLGSFGSSSAQTTAEGNLNIAGNASTTGVHSVDVLTVESTVSSSTFEGDIHVKGNAQIDGAIFFPASFVTSGNTTINGDFAVTGLTSLAGFISSASSTVSADFLVSGGTLNSSSTAIVNDLNILGTCTGCSSDVFGFPWTPIPALSANATSTLLIFDAGFISSASSTVASEFHALDITANTLVVNDNDGVDADELITVGDSNDLDNIRAWGSLRAGVDYVTALSASPKIIGVAGDTGRTWAGSSITELHIERNGAVYASLVSQANSLGQINFGDEDAEIRGFIRYNHDTVNANENANSLSFGTAGTSQVWIESTGFVGFGSSTPDSPLVIQQSSSGRPIHLRREASTANVNIQFENNTGSFWAGIDGADFIIGENGDLSASPLFVVQTGGSVGIGTAAPTGALQVTGDEMRIGDLGTPAIATADGDLYVEDALEVDGELQADGLLDANGQVALGDGGDTASITSSDWTISTAGNMTEIGTIASDGDWTQTSVSPSIAFVDTTASEDDYSIILSGSDFSIRNATDASSDFIITDTGQIYMPRVTSGDVLTDDLCIEDTDFYLIRDTQNNCASTSSLRFKENIEALTYGLDDVLKLHPVFFTYKESYARKEEDRNKRVGLIAEEMSLVMPELTFYEEDDGTTPRGIHYENLTAVLASAIQEMWGTVTGNTARIEALEVKNRALEERIRALEGKL